jgi:hypothetical protein
MRKITAIVALVVLSLATAAVAMAASNGAAGGVKYTSVGGNDTQTSFTAQGSPTDAKGNVVRKLTDPVTGQEVTDFRGDVTCYFQDGNVARFSGPITASKADAFPNDYYMIAVQDNGEGSNAPPDMIGNGRFATKPDCSQPLVIPVRPVEKGNLQVH